jgi:hypothetical protein
MVSDSGSYFKLNKKTFNDHVFFSCNDRMGSDKAQNEIMAINIGNGVMIQNYLLDVPLAGDWESMTLGPCTSNGTTSCLYIGNMGDNLANDCFFKNCTFGRSLLYIYKLEEPNVNSYYNGSAIKVSTLVINYSGSNFPTNRANSESLFVVIIIPPSFALKLTC